MFLSVNTQKTLTHLIGVQVDLEELLAVIEQKAKALKAKLVPHVGHAVFFIMLLAPLVTYLEWAFIHAAAADHITPNYHHHIARGDFHVSN